MRTRKLRLPAHRAATIEEQRHAYRLAAQLLAGRIEAGDVDAERLAAALLCGPLGPDFATATAA